MPRPPNVPLLGALWSLLDGSWGVLKGSSGVLVYDLLQPHRALYTRTVKDMYVTTYTCCMEAFLDNWEQEIALTGRNYKMLRYSYSTWLGLKRPSHRIPHCPEHET